MADNLNGSIMEEDDSFGGRVKKAAKRVDNFWRGVADFVNPNIARDGFTPSNIARDVNMWVEPASQMALDEAQGRASYPGWAYGLATIPFVGKGVAKIAGKAGAKGGARAGAKSGVSKTEGQLKKELHDMSDAEWNARKANGNGYQWAELKNGKLTDGELQYYLYNNLDSYYNKDMILEEARKRGYDVDFFKNGSGSSAGSAQPLVDAMNNLGKGVSKENKYSAISPDGYSYFFNSKEEAELFGNKNGFKVREYIPEDKIVNDIVDNGPKTIEELTMLLNNDGNVLSTNLVEPGQKIRPLLEELNSKGVKYSWDRNKGLVIEDVNAFKNAMKGGDAFEFVASDGSKIKKSDGGFVTDGNPTDADWVNATKAYNEFRGMNVIEGSRELRAKKQSEIADLYMNDKIGKDEADKLIEEIRYMSDDELFSRYGNGFSPNGKGKNSFDVLNEAEAVWNENPTLVNQARRDEALERVMSETNGAYDFVDGKYVPREMKDYTKLTDAERGVESVKPSERWGFYGENAEKVDSDAGVELTRRYDDAMARLRAARDAGNNEEAARIANEVGSISNEFKKLLEVGFDNYETFKITATNPKTGETVVREIPGKSDARNVYEGFREHGWNADIKGLKTASELQSSGLLADAPAGGSYNVNFMPNEGGSIMEGAGGDVRKFLKEAFSPDYSRGHGPDAAYEKAKKKVLKEHPELEGELPYDKDEYFERYGVDLDEDY